MFIDLATAGKKEEALKQLTEKVRPVSLIYFAILDKFLAYQTKMMVDSGDAAEQTATPAKIATLALAAAAAATAMMVSWVVARSIVRPIEEAVRVARRVADGDLTSTI